jgi:hypothetical protein
MPPDSTYIIRRGSDIVIGWYPPADSTVNIIGSRDFRYWYGVHGTENGVPVTFTGAYSGEIDRTITIRKTYLETSVVGTDPDIDISITTSDMFNRTYITELNIGTDHYNAGDPIPVILGEIASEGVADTLILGLNIHFGAGMVDTTLTGDFASLSIDLQATEGYHIWRGTSPYPSEMKAIIEISKEDYFRVSDVESYEDVPGNWKWLWEYFNDNIEPAWPRYDGGGRKYYEWIDDNVYPGFTYYYVVTTYDRGYFKGFFLYNKLDNFICDEDPDDPLIPGEPVLCEDAVNEFVMTVDTGTNLSGIYAVPNPYRTGTSAETSPYYHNYLDNTIKFFNVPREATIKIFTVAGDLVWESDHYSEDGTDGIISWNVRNKNGQDVTSGVYVYRIESSDGEGMYGRLVVIR